MKVAVVRKPIYASHRQNYYPQRLEEDLNFIHMVGMDNRFICSRPYLYFNIPTWHVKI